MVCDLFFRKPIIIVILSFVITYIHNQPLTKLDNKIRERDWSAMATELLCYYISWEETGHEFYILIRLRLPSNYGWTDLMSSEHGRTHQRFVVTVLDEF